MFVSAVAANLKLKLQQANQFETNNFEYIYFEIIKQIKIKNPISNEYICSLHSAFS